MTDDGRTIELMPTSGVIKRWTSMRACTNTTHGSGWIVQVQPTDEGLLLLSVASSNTTHGSGWIVQVQPTDEGFLLLPRIPPTAVGGSFRSCLHQRLANPSESHAPNGTRKGMMADCRQHLNNPPTAVGGILGSNRTRSTVGST